MSLGDFLSSVIGFMIAFAIWDGAKHFWENRRQPYRWMCPRPGCNFKVEANKPGIVTHMRVDHDSIFHSS